MLVNVTLFVFGLALAGCSIAAEARGDVKRAKHLHLALGLFVVAAILGSMVSLVDLDLSIETDASASESEWSI